MKLKNLTHLKFLAFSTNLAGKIDSYAAVLNLTADEVAAVKADNLFFAYVADMHNRMKRNAEDWTAYRNILRHSPKKVILGDTPPLTPVLPPPAVSADISGRLGRLIQRIKHHEKYTVAIGNDLGIVSVSDGPTPAELAALKPLLKIQLVAGQPVIKWKKGATDGIEIWKQLPGGDYQLLATNLHPHFQDKSMLPPAGKSEVWKYKAIYISGDQRVGQWSDEISIGVMG